VASTGARVAAASNPSAEGVIETGNARDARNASDAGDAMDVDVTSAADEVNPVSPATPSGRSDVTSVRDACRMPPPAALSRGPRASEKRTATRNANASANAPYQLYFCLLAPIFLVLSFSCAVFILLLLYWTRWFFVYRMPVLTRRVLDVCASLPLVVL